MNAKLSARSQLWLLWPLALCLMVWTRVGHAQTAPPFTTLYTFSALSNDSYGTNSDGGDPNAGLIQGKDGALYGSTFYGGVNGNGTIFRITTSGALTTLHTFADSDGSGPDGALLQATDGNLYGTTWSGGVPGSNGTVFKITTSGTITLLGSFNGGNGATPNGLIQGKDGNLYGTCVIGGTATYPGDGTVFKITPADTLSFVGFSGNDGNGPHGPIQAKDGKLYGTTDSGGANDQGTVFKLTTSGVLTRLYSFSALPNGYPYINSDGAQPAAGVIQGKDGALYGTTYYGGANGWGTIFRITTSGTLTTLYSFSAPTTTNNSDGLSPKGLLQGRDGNLYGVASLGGANNAGTVFKLTMIPVIDSFSPNIGPVGTFVTLTGVNLSTATVVKVGAVKASFTINSDTSLTLVVPPPGVASAKITVVNPFGQGVSRTAFIMAPIVTGFSPASGPVGASVTLTGVNLTGATSVKVGAMNASFTIQSDTSLTFVVPPGAKSAKITVVNPYGAGTSAAAFKVTP